MISNNPMLRNMFSNVENETILKPMTIEGTTNKFCMLMILLLASAGIIWYQFTLGRTDLSYMIGFGGMIAGIILSLIIAFVPTTAPKLSPLYAICEGAFIGSFSFIFELQFPGIVIKAVVATFMAALSVGILYRMGIIRATERFKAVIISATVAIMLFYLIALILSFTGIHLSYFAGANSPIFILLNAGIAILAAFNLILDFDFIEKGAQMNIPEHYEWFGAHGLLITIVWMYIEILRLLARLQKK